MASSSARQGPLLAWSSVLEEYASACPDLIWTPPPEGPSFLEVLRVECQARVTNLGLVSMPYRDVPHVARRGWLMPLDKALPPRARSRYAAQALALCTVDGKLYAAPEDFSSFVTVVRRDLLEKFGLKLPQSRMELGEQASRLAREFGGPTLGLLGGGFLNRVCFYHALLDAEALDPRALTQDPAAFGASHEWLRGLSGAEGARLPANFLDREACEKSLARLREGTSAFGFGWPSAIADWPARLLNHVELLPFPPGSSGKRVRTPMRGRAWVVPRNSKAPDRAFRALRAIQEPSLVRRMVLQGGLPFPAFPELWRDREILARHPLFRFAPAVLESEAAFAPHTRDPALRDFDEVFRSSFALRASSGECLRALARRMTPREQPQARHPAVRRAQTFIEANLGTLRGVGDVGEAVGLSRPHLHRLFRQDLQDSCGAYIAGRRMEAARRMLFDLTLSLKEIAYRTGFHSPQYFSQAFRRRWGVSASRMRKKLLEMR